jgi:choline-glycine betaine transporter
MKLMSVFSFLLACLAVILFTYGAAERFSAYIEEFENTANEERAAIAEAYRQSWGIDKWTIASGACVCAAIASGVAAFKQPKNWPSETG